ncbi:MAG: DUF5673 domain-containing protein [Bacillota bacterium]
MDFFFNLIFVIGWIVFFSYLLLRHIKSGDELYKSKVNKSKLYKIGYFVFVIYFFVLLNDILVNGFVLNDLFKNIIIIVFSIFLIWMDKSKLYIKEKGIISGDVFLKWEEIKNYNWDKNILKVILNQQNKTGVEIFNLNIDKKDKQKINQLLNKKIN